MGVGPITPESAETLADDPAFLSRFLSIAAAAEEYAPIVGSEVYATNLQGRSGDYWSVLGIDPAAGVAVSVGLILYAPIYVPGPADRIVCEVTTAGGGGTKLKMGLYTRTAAGLPGNKLTESEDLDAGSTGVREGTINYTGTAGWLFASFVTSAASLSVRQHGGTTIGMPAGTTATQAMSDPRAAWYEIKPAGYSFPVTATPGGGANFAPRMAVRLA